MFEYLQTYTVNKTHKFYFAKAPNESQGVIFHTAKQLKYSIVILTK